VARRPIADWTPTARSSSAFVYASGTTMKPIFMRWPSAPRRKRVAYAEGEDERVLRAVQVVVDEGLARPMLIGRPAVIEPRIDKLRPAAAGRGDSTWSMSSTIRVTATSGRPTTR
jgi:malate dehydrogenase (oxaloacetate-decarboxylating)(NADP+)